MCAFDNTVFTAFEYFVGILFIAQSIFRCHVSAAYVQPTTLPPVTNDPGISGASRDRPQHLCGIWLYNTDMLYCTVIRAAFCNTSANESTWSVSNGACYFVSRQPTTWQRARQFCVAKGAELTSVRDGAENSFVQRIVRSAFALVFYLICKKSYLHITHRIVIEGAI